jgi:hypothetical protein
MRERSEIPQIVLGAMGVLIINLVICVIGYGIAITNYLNGLFLLGVFLIGGISLAQLIYVIPVIYWLKQRQQFSWMKGVTIGAVITALLNGSCYLILLLPR